MPEVAGVQPADPDGSSLGALGARLSARAGSVGDLLVGVDEPLGGLTTYRVGGPAALLVRIESAEALVEVAAARLELAPDAPVLAVGKGSNLLVSDRGFAGLAIVLGDAFAEVSITGCDVRAGAAASLPVVARRTAAASLTGFEWAVGVPGSIGGAVRMNAGGHGSDMSECLTGVRVVDLSTGQHERVPVAALGLRYRRSSLPATQLVVEAEIVLAPGDRATSEAELTDIVRWRREHQPGGANAGSVFTNPPGDAAGALIDRAGLKGHRVGSAHVSPKHANFIQADPGGTASDVLAVMRTVTDTVLSQFGVQLIPETRLVGFEPDEIDPAWLGANPQLLMES